MLQAFDICPTFASKREVKDEYHAVAVLQTPGQAKSEERGSQTIDFESFKVLLARMARLALSKPPFSTLYQTPLSKAEVLLDLWGLGNQTKIREVVRVKM